ncbi:MAG: ABC transporter permease [Cyanobacteria bacterium P01_H01_bin.119]
MTKYWRETLAIAQRILTELLRRRRSLLFWAIFPVIVMILNGLILEERTGLSRSEALQIALPPTLVGAALFFSCLGGSVATLVSEREQQTLKRLFLSPLSGLSYFLGVFVAHSVIGLAQALIIYGIALSGGSRFDGPVLLQLAIIWASIAAYVGLGFVLGTQFARRTEDVNALISAFGVPLLILGGAFLPTQLFPDSLLQMARFNPIFHMIEALTAVAIGNETLSETADHLWFLAVFAAVMALAGWLAYRRMVQVERQL